MTWAAEFADGPMAGQRHVFMAGAPTVLYAIPDPRPDQWWWIIVGVDEPPDVPWPEQVEYRLAGTRPAVPDDEDDLIAVYRIEPAARRPRELLLDDLRTLEQDDDRR